MHDSETADKTKDMIFAFGIYIQVVHEYKYVGSVIGENCHGI